MELSVLLSDFSGKTLKLWVRVLGFRVSDLLERVRQGLGFGFGVRARPLESFINGEKNEEESEEAGRKAGVF